LLPASEPIRFIRPRHADGPGVLDIPELLCPKFDEV